MGERKIFSKYIPADFDPSLVPRGKKLSTKDGTVPVRMMLPFSIQCDSCHTFLYRGTKYNSKKEPMGGPNGRYLGILRFRFYIKCNHCKRTISFLTDPQNADYEMETGGTRNYEIFRDKVKTTEEATNEQEEEEKIDPLKALENRVLDSRREMEDLDNLEEIKAMNKRHIQLLSKSGVDDFDADTKAVLAALEEKDKPVDTNELGTTAEEESLIKSIKFGQSESGIIRLNDRDEELEEARRERQVVAIRAQKQKDQAKSTSVPKPVVPGIRIKAKRKKPLPVTESLKKSKVDDHKKPAPPTETSLAGLLGGYGSSDSD